MGIFYNDLKSLTFHLIQTENFFDNINKEEVSLKRGEYGGIKNHIFRITVATIYEFLEFIDKNENVIKKDEFSILYKKMNSTSRKNWDLIVNISKANELKSKNRSDFSKILEIIRNNDAFHYYASGKVLRSGFIKFFYQDPKQPGNEKAYYTLEEDMQNTRFFYCDAASQGSISSQIIKYTKISVEEFNNLTRTIIDYINFTIMALMKEYLRNRPH